MSKSAKHQPKDPPLTSRERHYLRLFLAATRCLPSTLCIEVDSGVGITVRKWRPEGSAYRVASLRKKTIAF